MTDAFPPGYDASDETAENNALRDEARRQREDAATVRHLLSHKNGRAWFHRVLDRCHIFGTPFAVGDPHTTFFQLGEENIGKRLLSQVIEVCPDLYLTMLAEAKKEEDRVTAVRVDEEKKRQGEEDVGLKNQGFELPPPEGWQGHVPPVKP